LTVFSNAATWLQNKRLAHALIDVTYERGSASAAIQAWIGRTLYDEIDDAGVIIRNESRDYYFAISAYDDAGFEVPQIGDLIKEDTGAGEVVYRVQAPFGMQHYDRDTHRLRYRIHTKRISDEYVASDDALLFTGGVTFEFVDETDFEYVGA